jgi:SAM-dependent methyltransferase
MNEPRRGAKRDDRRRTKRRSKFTQQTQDRSSRSGNPTRSLSSPTQWDGVADWYDSLVGADGSEYQREIIIPGLLRLLKPVRGERVLDIGCGQGVVSRVLHGIGAHMIGVDASRSLVQLARERSDPSISYVVGDARDLQRIPAVEPASFDAAVCVLAIQNIHPLQPVFDGVSSALKSGGRFVVVMMHPCFRSPQATQWGWDEAAGIQFRRVDQYLLPRKHPIVAHPGKEPSRYTWTFHRPLQSYVKSMSRAGLCIDGMEEWTSHKLSEPGPRAKAENSARREIPMFIAIRARRCVATQVAESAELEGDVPGDE